MNNKKYKKINNIDDDYYNSNELLYISKNKNFKEPYIFTITAVNTLGETVSDPTAEISPLTVPDPPTNVISKLNTDKTISVSFTPPTNNGGSSIKNYTVYATGTSIFSNDINLSKTANATANDTTITITFLPSELTIGYLYKFKVKATNNVGDSLYTTEEFPILGLVYSFLPDPPTNVVANINTDKTISVSFTPPTNNGGSSIKSYTVNATSSSGKVITKSTTDTFSLKPTINFSLTDLTLGETYKFKVKATNNVGDSLYTTEVPIQGLLYAFSPDPPTNVVSTLNTDNKTVLVSFIPPNNNGGSYINSYIVTATPTTGTSITQTGPSSPITLTGLILGQTYNFKVNSINNIGKSNDSNVTSIKYAFKPSVPANFTGTSDNNKINFSFKVPDNNGSPITKYILKGYYNDSTGKLIYEQDELTGTNLLGLTSGNTGTFSMGTTDRTKKYTGLPISSSGSTGTITADMLVSGSTGTTDNTLSIIQPYKYIKLDNYKIGKEKCNLKWFFIIILIILLIIYTCKK